MKSIFLLIAIIFSVSVSAQNADSVFTITENPFRDSTQFIIYDLDADTISLEIYDLTGRLSATLYSKNILSGTVTLTFHADSLKEGMYIAVLTKNSETHTLRILKQESVALVENESSFQIYPNPVSEILTIDSKVPIEKIELYSLEGKAIKINTDISNTHINVSNLANGVYLLKIASENAFHIQKVIIH
jgi:hypothetical protein